MIYSSSVLKMDGRVSERLLEFAGSVFSSVFTRKGECSLPCAEWPLLRDMGGVSELERTRIVRPSFRSMYPEPLVGGERNLVPAIADESFVGAGRFSSDFGSCRLLLVSPCCWSGCTDFSSLPDKRL